MNQAIVYLNFLFKICCYDNPYYHIMFRFVDTYLYARSNYKSVVYDLLIMEPLFIWTCHLYKEKVLLLIHCNPNVMFNTLLLKQEIFLLLW